MNIVYLIGNGFDLNLGLKTRYSDFYDYYLKQYSSKPNINNFKSKINLNIELWSDLELALAKQTTFFSNESSDQFIDILDDIQDNLAEYIDVQDKEFNITEVSKKKFIDNLCFPEKYLDENDRREIEIFKEKSFDDFRVSVINFNYTNTFKKVFSYKKNSEIFNSMENADLLKNYYFNEEIHIHGTTKSNMLIGVNDYSQIENKEFQKNSFILDNFVKERMNDLSNTTRKEKCIKIIDSASLICIFGMSFGETDKFWWNKILKKLGEENVKVIIFDIDKSFNERRQYRIKTYEGKIREKLLKYSTFSENELKVISKKIYVCLNTDMFKVRRVFGATLEKVA